MLLLLTAPLSAAPVTTWQGRTRVRERALLDGIPVADAEVIREFGPTGVRVHRAGRIPAPRTDAIAVLSAEDARSRVEDVALAEPALAWLEGRLVWEVPLYGVVTGVEGVAWVDAHDGRVVTRWRRASSLGRVYAVAPEPEDLVDVTLVDREIGRAHV